MCSDFGAPKNKVWHCFHCFPIYFPWSDGTGPMMPSWHHEDAMIFVFWMLSFKPTFSLSSFTFIKRLFQSSSLSAIRVVSSAYLRLLTFLPAILISGCDSSNPAFLYRCSIMHCFVVIQSCVTVIPCIVRYITIKLPKLKTKKTFDFEIFTIMTLSYILYYYSFKLWDFIKIQTFSCWKFFFFITIICMVTLLSVHIIHIFSFLSLFFYKKLSYF